MAVSGRGRMWSGLARYQVLRKECVNNNKRISVGCWCLGMSHRCRCRGALATYCLATTCQRIDDFIIMILTTPMYHMDEENSADYIVMSGCEQG